MKIGIFGLPMSGKTTIFSLLTEQDYDPSYKSDAEEKVALVKDERITNLSKMYNPKKTTYATINLVDIPSFDSKADAKEKSRILQMIQNVDAMVLVLRAFENEQVPFPEENETPLKQLNTLISEMIFRDIEVVENRIERLNNSIKKNKASKEEQKEYEIITKISEVLNEEKFAKDVELSDDEEKLISSLSLFTLKPMIVVVNVDEDQFMNDDYDGKEEVLDIVKRLDLAYLEISGKIEADINGLDEEEKKEFMEELNIKSPGIDRLSKVVYDHIGLISYFTVGEDEVRAWTIKKNTNMKEAAGAIHTALSKNFIKAQVMKYKDLIEYKSEQTLKDKGLVKLAGKDEIVEDGDILEIRANS